MSFSVLILKFSDFNLLLFFILLYSIFYSLVFCWWTIFRKLYLYLLSSKKNRNYSRLDMCRRNYPTDVCNRGTAGKCGLIMFATNLHQTPLYIFSSLPFTNQWNLLFIFLSYFFSFYSYHNICICVCVSKQCKSRIAFSQIKTKLKRKQHNFIFTPILCYFIPKQIFWTLLAKWCTPVQCASTYTLFTTLLFLFSTIPYYSYLLTSLSLTLSIYINQNVVSHYTFFLKK